MNKKLLVAAIAAGLMVPGMAAADVKIFGTVQAETGNIDVDAPGTAADSDTTHMGNGGSGAINGGGSNAWGIKGTEKLGNGLSAYFKLNHSFSTFNGGANGGRDRFVGVKGDGWHAQFGRMNSRYKASSAGYDALIATGLQARAIGAVSGLHNGYVNDVAEVGFKSGGVSGGVQVTWDEVNVGDQGNWNANIKYGEKNWEVGLAYLDWDFSNAATTGTSCTAGALTGGVCVNARGSVLGAPVTVITAPANSGNVDAWKIHGKYAGDGFGIMAQYESVDADTNGVVNSAGMMGRIGNGATSADGYDSLMITGTFSISDATTLVGRYANTDWDDVGGVAGADVDGDHWAIAVTHGLSKRTHVYGGYMANNYDPSGTGDTDVDAWGIGMRHKF